MACFWTVGGNHGAWYHTERPLVQKQSKLALRQQCNPQSNSVARAINNLKMKGNLDWSLVLSWPQDSMSHPHCHKVAWLDYGYIKGPLVKHKAGRCAYRRGSFTQLTQVCASAQQVTNTWQVKYLNMRWQVHIFKQACATLSCPFASTAITWSKCKSQHVIPKEGKSFKCPSSYFVCLEKQFCAKKSECNAFFSHRSETYFFLWHGWSLWWFNHPLSFL